MVKVIATSLETCCILRIHVKVEGKNSMIFYMHTMVYVPPPTITKVGSWNSLKQNEVVKSWWKELRVLFVLRQGLCSLNCPGAH